MESWKETKCGKCKIQRRKPICNNCRDYDKFVPITNADHIRSMGDEELAEFIINGCQGQSNRMEIQDLLDWLHLEAE